MLKIVEITPQKRRLYAVRISEEYTPESVKTTADGALLLDRDYCDENGFKTGLELTFEKLEEHCYLSELRRAKQKAMWLLEQQDYPSGKLMEKLRKDHTFSVCADAVSRLAEVGLVNDRAYAVRAVQSLINKGTPRRQLAFALAQKGVDMALAKEIASEAESDDREVIAELLRTKYSRKLSNENDIKKTVAALMRRGFSYADVKAVMGDMSDGFYYDNDL